VGPPLYFSAGLCRFLCTHIVFSIVPPTQRLFLSFLDILSAAPSSRDPLCASDSWSLLPFSVSDPSSSGFFFLLVRPPRFYEPLSQRDRSALHQLLRFSHGHLAGPLFFFLRSGFFDFFCNCREIPCVVCILDKFFASIGPSSLLSLPSSVFLACFPNFVSQRFL